MSTEAIEQAVATAQAEVAQDDAKVAADEALLAADQEADAAAHAKLDAATEELEQAKAAEAAEGTIDMLETPAEIPVDSTTTTEPTSANTTAILVLEVCDEMAKVATQIGGEVADRFLHLINLVRGYIYGAE